MNKVMIVGSLISQELITKETEKEKLVINNIIVGVNRFKDGVDSIKMTAFGTNASFIDKNINEGDMVVIEGTVRTKEIYNVEKEKTFFNQNILIQYIKKV